MIVTLTMNPAIDKSTSVDSLLPEKKLRCGKVIIEAGGGGINVSKGLKKLGEDSLCIFPGGGSNSSMLQGYLKELGIRTFIIPIAGETRESLHVTEERTNAQYRFILPGPELSAKESEQCLKVLTELRPAPEYLIASGSLPQGVPDDFFKRIAISCKEMNTRFILDTSGKPLELAAEEGVFLLKPNLHELCTLAGKEHLEMNEVDDAAIEMIKKNKAEVLLVSMGPSGALLVTKDGYEHIPAPTVKKNTTVGAGDSMVAGMLYKLSQGKSLREMARYGVACGTAATMTSGTKLFNVSDANRLFEWIEKFSDKYKTNFENKP